MDAHPELHHGTRGQASDVLQRLFTSPPPPTRNLVQDPNLTLGVVRGQEAPVRPNAARGLSPSQTVQPAQSKSAVTAPPRAATEAAGTVHAQRPQPPVAPGQKPAGPPVGPPDPPAPGKENVMTAARKQALQEAGGLLRDVTIGKGTSEHPWALAGISRTTDGALAVADALELSVTGKPQNTMKFLDTVTRNTDSTRGFSYALSNAAHVAPERAVGIMLLTTDAPGGRDAISNLFHSFAQDQPSSQNLASVLEASSRTPGSARGMVELLDVLSQPEQDNWNHATKLADSLSRTTDYVHGSKAVSQALLNTLDVEGGSRNFATLINRMSRSDEGQASTRQMLLNMSFDREGASSVGKMLARASTSRGGAAEVLDSLNRMAQSPSGQRDVARLLNRVAQVPEGGRFLSNLFKDEAHSDGLVKLLNTLGKDPNAKAFLSSAFNAVDTNRRTIADAEVIRGRMEANADVKAALNRVWGDAPASAPTANWESYQQALTSEAALRNATRDTLELQAAPTSVNIPGAALGLEQGQVVQASSAAAPAASASAEAGTGGVTAAPAAGGADSAQAGPPVGQTREADPSRPDDLQDASPRREAADRVGGVREESYREQVRQANESRSVKETTESSQTRAASDAHRADQAERAGNDEQRLYSFRPGDVYSEDTLKMLRICAECGFRTTAAGLCPRCASK